MSDNNVSQAMNEALEGKKHWFMFTVMYKDFGSTGHTTRSGSTEHKRVTSKDIDNIIELVKSENKAQQALVVSISYLGYMTEEEYLDEEDDEETIQGN